MPHTNLSTPFGEPPLHTAAERAGHQFARILLRQEANLEFVDRMG
jgi:hypothetical protein